MPADLGLRERPGLTMRSYALDRSPSSINLCLRQGIVSAQMRAEIVPVARPASVTKSVSRKTEHGDSARAAPKCHYENADLSRPLRHGIRDGHSKERPTMDSTSAKRKGSQQRNQRPA